MLECRRALLFFAGVSAIGCNSASDPERLRALLIVVPSATEVASTAQTVSYRIAEGYPAERTLKAIGDALAGHQCRPQEQDPFNPEPVFTMNKWIERTPEGGGASTLFWSGAWICPPDRDLVMFVLRTTRDGSAPPSVEVKAVYYSAKQFATFGRLAADPGNAGIALGGGNLATGGQHTPLQTCSVCGSTRKRVDNRPWKVLYLNPTAAPHEHKWSDGVHSAAPVRDGVVVLVRRRMTLDDPSYVYGAFVLDSERSDPKERTDYKWIMRTDGGSLLDPSLPSVTTGSAKDKNGIAFGPLRVSWSGGEPGRGYVYYPRFAGSSRSSEDWELSITELTSFERVDAADPHFVYKSSPGD
jgi:hypothetical protein